MANGRNAKKLFQKRKGKINGRQGVRWIQKQSDQSKKKKDTNASFKLLSSEKYCGDKGEQ